MTTGRTPRQPWHLRQRLRALAVVAAVAAVLSMAACSSSGSASSANGGTAASASAGSPAAVTAADAAVAALKAGTYTQPPATGPRAVRGKTVWIVSCGQTTDCAIEAQAIANAGQTLGWTTRVCDGKEDQDNAYGTCVEQAVSARASGIITLSVDCSVIKSALLEAKAAKIPVVNNMGFDCNETSPTSGPPLFTAEVQPSATVKTTTQWNLALGQAEAQWLISNGNGKAKVINLAFNGNSSGIVANQGIDSTLAKCSGCSLYLVPETLQQVNPQDITSQLQSALLRHPDANSAVCFVGAQFELGGAQALKTSGRKIAAVTSGSGPQLMDLVRSNLLTAVIATDYVWDGYASADTLNRVFAGAPIVPEGLGLQLVYPGHGVPATGSYQFPGINYRADYEKVWTGAIGA
jgi:ribose transport system substrate-binding protein